MSLNKFTFDLVIPIYNPSIEILNNIESKIGEFKNAMHNVDVKPILVNDGSHPSVKAAVEKIEDAHIIHLQKNMGKGSALRCGFAHSSSDFCMFTDVDFPYTLESMLKSADQVIHGNADICLGRRSTQYYDSVGWQRKYISGFLKWLIKVFLRIPITDTQAGLKSFNIIGKQVLLHTSTNRYLIDLELIKNAHKEKLSLVAIPIELRSGVRIPKMGLKVIVRELFEFIKIVFS